MDKPGLVETGSGASRAGLPVVSQWERGLLLFSQNPIGLQWADDRRYSWGKSLFLRLHGSPGRAACSKATDNLPALVAKFSLQEQATFPKRGTAHFKGRKHLIVPTSGKQGSRSEPLASWRGVGISCDTLKGQVFPPPGPTTSATCGLV